MPRFVIGLEHDGHRLKNEIIVYIQESQQPNDAEHLESIYAEINHQIVHAFDKNFDTFMLNIMSVPNFMTINYTDNEIDFNLIRRFGDQVRSYAVRVWNFFYPKLSERYRGGGEQFVLVMESVTSDYMVLNAYLPNFYTGQPNPGAINDIPAF